MFFQNSMRKSQTYIGIVGFLVFFDGQFMGVVYVRGHRASGHRRPLAKTAL